MRLLRAVATRSACAPALCSDASPYYGGQSVVWSRLYPFLMGYQRGYDRKKKRNTDWTWRMSWWCCSGGRGERLFSSFESSEWWCFIHPNTNNFFHLFICSSLYLHSSNKHHPTHLKLENNWFDLVAYLGVKGHLHFVSYLGMKEHLRSWFDVKIWFDLVTQLGVKEWFGM